MARRLDVITEGKDIAEFVTNSVRPDGFDKEGRPLVVNRQTNKPELMANAFLSKEEWERLDAAVINRAQERLNAWQDVLNAGLVEDIDIADWLSSYRVASERIVADVTMDFETAGEEDRRDMKRYSIPIPIITARFSFGRRELASILRAGRRVDTGEAEAAAEAVADAMEVMLIDGNSSAVLEGNSVLGYTSIGQRITGTAAAQFSGGDFGTLSNIYPTFQNMCSQLAAIRYYGPYQFYIHNTQYNEMLVHYSDGTGDTALDRVLRHPRVADIKINDRLAAGELVGLELSRPVVDIHRALTIQTRRWEHPSGNRVYYNVVAAAAPRVKQDYAGNCGIAHATSC